MGEATKIQWCDYTFNPWRGCAKVHEGCAHCYAEQNMSVKLHGIKWGPNGTRVRLSDTGWKEPLKWNRQAGDSVVIDHAGKRLLHRPKVFCASLADVFEDWNGPILHANGNRYWFYEPNQGYISLPPYQEEPQPGLRPATMDHLRRDLFALIDKTPNLDWLLLTKRPENIRRMWPMSRGYGMPPEYRTPPEPGDPVFYRPNVWLLTSVSNQQTADRMIPELLKCRDLCPVLGISAEPLLGPIDLRGQCDCHVEIQEGAGNHATNCAAVRVRPLDWVIVGGESGPRARPCQVEWIRSLVEQCEEARTMCFVKQLGSHVVCDELKDDCQDWPCGTKARGNRENWRIELRDPKGGDPSEWPEDLRVREYPEVHHAKN